MSSDEGEAEFGDEDDVPLASLKKSTSSDSRESPRRKRKAVNYADDDDGDEEEEAEFNDDDDDDDEDDVPLVSLKKKTSKSPSKAKAASKPQAAAKKKAKAAPPTPVKTTSSSKTDFLSASAAFYESGCVKGMLVQKLLCRWWYAVTWPDPATLPPAPPPHYDPLNGFEGVYVCTSGDKVGDIMDLRSQENKPCFTNYAKKSSQELQELLLKALEEQKRQLVEAEGSGTATEKEINDEIKWVTKKIKPASADKEALKVLKAAKMSL